ncbi:hypothetical protein ABC345_01960 [Shouchella sp. 1P09AA]|uniref:hypothetical protein n=1 Tax=unclassified Shouchella TaxID=2893065 RepID=UPI00399F0DA2
MTRLSRVEKIRIEKRDHRIKLTRTGVITTFALGLAGCVQASAQGELMPTNQSIPLSQKDIAQCEKETHPNYLYSMYKYDRLDHEIKVYGFKNTNNEKTDKWTFTSDKQPGTLEDQFPKNHHEVEEEVATSIGSFTTNSESDLIQEERSEPSKEAILKVPPLNVRDQDQLHEKENKENLGEDNQLGIEQTENIQEATAVKDSNNELDQEQSKPLVKWNNHGKVVYVEQTRFAIETEYGDKWFVVDETEKINQLKPNMAVSVYYQEVDNMNVVTDFFITYKPEDKTEEEILEGTYLSYADDNQKAIRVYIPHQEIIYDLAPSLYDMTLYEYGTPIMFTTKLDEEGRLIVTSINDVSS